ncbi:MAG TPA: hypothetical protein V6C97_33915 [Oculatellaceae cyanobacterium]
MEIGKLNSDCYGLKTVEANVNAHQSNLNLIAVSEITKSSKLDRTFTAPNLHELPVIPEFSLRAIPEQFEPGPVFDRAPGQIDPIAKLFGWEEVYSFLSNNFDRIGMIHGNGFVDGDDLKWASTLFQGRDKEICDLLELSSVSHGTGGIWDMMTAPGDGPITRASLKSLRERLDTYNQLRQHEKQVVPDLYDALSYARVNWSKLSNFAGEMTESRVEQAVREAASAEERRSAKTLELILRDTFRDHHSPINDWWLQHVQPHVMDYDLLEDIVDGNFLAKLPVQESMEYKTRIPNTFRLDVYDWWLRKNLYS